MVPEVSILHLGMVKTISKVVKRNGLETYNPVDDSGRFISNSEQIPDFYAVSISSLKVIRLYR